MHIYLFHKQQIQSHIYILYGSRSLEISQRYHTLITLRNKQMLFFQENDTQSLSVHFSGKHTARFQKIRTLRRDCLTQNSGKYKQLQQDHIFKEKSSFSAIFFHINLFSSCTTFLEDGISHFGRRRNSWVSQTAILSKTSEPDWWVAARGVGTYVRRVEIPRDAWNTKILISKTILGIINIMDKFLTLVSVNLPHKMLNCIKLNIL